MGKLHGDVGGGEEIFGNNKELSDFKAVVLKPTTHRSSGTDVVVLDNEGFHSELLGYRMSTDKDYVPIILKFSSESVLFVSTLTIAL